MGQFVLLGILLVVSLPSLARLAPRSLADWLLIGFGGAAMVAAGGVVIAGLRGLGAGLTPMPRPREGAVLVEHGVYAVVRHPIYAGLVLGSLGWSAVTRSLLAAGVALLLGIYFDIKSRREEAWLAERYPGYDGYRSRTRRFVPFIY